MLDEKILVYGTEESGHLRHVNMLED